MTTSADQSYLSRVFAATSTEESRKLYDEWAASYDSEMIAHDFTGARLVADGVARTLKHTPQSQAQILDTGCGSGAVGIELQKLGFKTIDGLDLSEGMLGVARKTGAYRKLEIADLTQRLDVEDGKYDVLTCCGTFTHGHLGPEPLDEFVRAVKQGGVLVATVLDSHWVERGFEKKVESLAQDGIIELLENDIHAYRKDAGGGRVLIVRKTS